MRGIDTRIEDGHRLAIPAEAFRPRIRGTRETYRVHQHRIDDAVFGNTGDIRIRQQRAKRGAVNGHRNVRMEPEALDVPDIETLRATEHSGLPRSYRSLSSLIGFTYDRAW